MTKNKWDHYILLSELFEYPDENYTDRLHEVNHFLKLKYPDAAGILAPFVEYMISTDIYKQQELFIRSFDVQAVTTLGLGYVVFGDDYKRGELLVNLNREHREVQNDCGNELADHLPNVLRLIAKMNDPDIAYELIVKIVAPALRKMIKSFDSDQIKLKDTFYTKKYKTILDRPEDHYTIFQNALESIYNVMEHDFTLIEIDAQEKTSDFLKNIVKEVHLEDK